MAIFLVKNWFKNCYIFGLEKWFIFGNKNDYIFGEEIVIIFVKRWLYVWLENGFIF